MPDASYDAIIIGGGSKGLACAMYLQRYGGMSVGIFDRRHEIGGGWATEEAAAPGFLSNTHAQMIYAPHYLALERDFPEFDGADLAQYKAVNSAIFLDKQDCLVTYSLGHDPTQEKTAKEIARFSEKDAELWLKAWAMHDLTLRQWVESWHYPIGLLEMKQMENAPALLAAIQQQGLEVEPIDMMYSPLRSVKEWIESKEMQCVLLRMALSAGTDITLPGRTAPPFMMMVTRPYMGFNVGGTHQVAHACHKILVADGAKVWTHCEVDKILIENGTAKGIRLTDGTEIEARKLVISTLSPQQLVDMIGKENLSSKIVRRVELIETNHTTIGWYCWALHEKPRYIAADFNPDIDDAMWVGLHLTNDPDTMARECYWRRLGKMPPWEDLNPVVWGHSMVDPTYAPPGKFLASHEQFMPPASALTEREWLELKKQHAEDMIKWWQQFAPNMTWDNVIGYNPDTPYDCCRLMNMAPDGNWSVIDTVPTQVGRFRPIPELSEHRTPVNNLYATGAAWAPYGAGAMIDSGYTCYRIIADDLELAKPWLEPGKEEPDSLLEYVKKHEQKWIEQDKAREKAEEK